ncbi:MAG: hypothetical protein M9946_05510 [Nocardioidaceae bacterium]|nr:hypothetical protein [Nocardioidaceae bacterium]
MNRANPVRVGSDSDWSSVSAGTNYACGVRAGGQLWCWGDNFYAQLGDGTTADRLAPTRIGAAADWSAIATSSTHTCGLRSGGQAWCWGSNSNGELGDGTNIDRQVPVQVGSASDWSTVSSGYGHSCGVRTGSTTAWCWGRNNHGQLGDGTNVDRLIPVLSAP